MRANELNAQALATVPALGAVVVTYFCVRGLWRRWFYRRKFKGYGWALSLLPRCSAALHVRSRLKNSMPLAFVGRTGPLE